MRTPARRLALSAVLLLALAACGDGTRTSSSPSPTGPQTPPEPDPTATETMEVTAWFVRAAGERLWVEPETHERPASPAVAQAAIELMLEGDTRDPNLSTLAPEGTRVLAADIQDAVLVIDLSEEITSVGRSSTEETAFAQQLAYTGSQFGTVDAVRLWVEGGPVDELWGHLDWSEPIERAPFAETPVTFDRPRWGQTLERGPVTAGGEANTFEATVELQLIDPDGQVVEETFTTATSGTGTRGTWQHTFEQPADRPGNWVIEAAEPDPSGGEGFPPVVVRVEFEVT